MEIGNPNTANVWISDDGSKIHCKRLPIGVWNMDSTSTKFIDHNMGSNYIKILFVTAMIIDDAGVSMYLLDLHAYATDSGLKQGGVAGITITGLWLHRITGGWFDVPGFSSGVINRGYIDVIYSE